MKTWNLRLIDYQILIMAGLASFLEDLPNLLLQQAEGLADLGENSRFQLRNSENEANLLVLLW